MLQNKKQSHYHVTTAIDQQKSCNETSSKSFAVPMSLPKSKMFLQDFFQTPCNGEMIYKPQEAVIYIEQRQLNVSSANKRLTNVNLITTKTVQFQINFVPMSTSARFLGNYRTTYLRN